MVVCCVGVGQRRSGTRTQSTSRIYLLVHRTSRLPVLFNASTRNHQRKSDLVLLNISMSRQQHYHGERRYERDSYGGGAGRGDEREGGSAGRWQRGDQRGNGGRGGSGGRSGGRISGGRFWSEQRQMIEENGIKVTTNCFQLKPVSSSKENTNAVIHQYAVRIDTLVKRRDDPPDDGTYAPALEASSTITEMMKPFILVKKESTKKEKEDDDRSTLLSRRVLNHCQQKLQQVTPHQMFVSFHCTLSIYLWIF